MHRPERVLAAVGAALAAGQRLGLAGRRRTGSSRRLATAAVDALGAGRGGGRHEKDRRQREGREEDKGGGGCGRKLPASKWSPALLSARADIVAESLAYPYRSPSDWARWRQPAARGRGPSVGEEPRPSPSQSCGTVSRPQRLDEWASRQKGEKAAMCILLRPSTTRGTAAAALLSERLRRRSCERVQLRRRIASVQAYQRPLAGQRTSELPETIDVVQMRNRRPAGRRGVIREVS